MLFKDPKLPILFLRMLYLDATEIVIPNLFLFPPPYPLQHGYKDCPFCHTYNKVRIALSYGRFIFELMTLSLSLSP